MDYKKPIEDIVTELLKEQLTVAFAESVTAGMLQSEFAGANGVASVFLGGVVTYSEKSKTDLLSVKPYTLKKYSAESPEVTLEMAKGLGKFFKADMKVAVTGLASTGGSESAEKPVGTIFVTILTKLGVEQFQGRFYGNRDTIREQAVYMIIEKMNSVLLKLIVKKREKASHKK